MADKKNNGGQMRNTQIYLLKLDSSSHKALRLWTGKSLHALRHCSVKQMGSALAKMQKNVDALQESLGMLKHVKEQFASVSAASVRATMEQDNGSSMRGPRLAGHDSQRRSPKVPTGHHGPAAATWRMFSKQRSQS